MLAVYAQRIAGDAQRFWKPLLALGGVSLALMAGALYLTFSRGALLGIAAAVLALLFGLNRRSAFLVLGALAVAGAVALIAVPPGPPPSRNADSATAVRVAGCASYGRGPSYRGCGPR